MILSVLVGAVAFVLIAAGMDWAVADGAKQSRFRRAPRRVVLVLAGVVLVAFVGAVLVLFLSPPMEWCPDGF